VNHHTQHEDEELGIKPIPMDFKEIDPLVDQFADNQYWPDLNILGNKSVDDLMADYEWATHSVWFASTAC